MSHQNESSVEEILESIKKVIARDNRAGAMEQRRRRETEGVIEPADECEAEEVLDLNEAHLIENSDDETESGEIVGQADQAESDEELPLLNDAARESMRDNLAALAMLAEPGKRPRIVQSGETSLEQLVREMLRPMLSEWLDQNLPSMVEKMVQNEISRIAGKRG